MRSIIIILFFIAASSQVFCQQIPLNAQVKNRLDELIMESDTSLFTGFRAMNWLELKQTGALHKADVTDSAFGLYATGNNYPTVLDKLAYDNWIKAGRHNSYFTIDPYLDADIGKSDKVNKQMYNISGGLRLQATINDRFSFNLSVITGSTTYPQYVDSVIKLRNNIIPGLNMANPQSKRKYTNTYPDFNFTFSPNQHFLISAGFGKQFLGDGYRSLLLSDNSYSYPYIRLQTRFWKLTYNVLFNQYENKSWYYVDGSSQKKYSTIHYLGVNIGKKIQVGLFDDIVWLGKDSNAHRGFDVQYLNPVIFLRPLEYALGSPDNAMIGFTVKYKFYNKGYLYSQVALDDLNLKLTLDSNSQFYGNKYAVQLGVYNKDIFGIKGFSHRLEFNSVRPYTYGHGVGQSLGVNYTHFYQSITDPMDANFNEGISIFQYHYGRLYGRLENMYAVRGEKKPGSTTNNGEDLFGGENGIQRFHVTTMQGIKTKYFYNDFVFGYYINPKNGLALQGDITYRQRTSSIVKQKEFIFSIGIKTNIFNFYRDF